MFRYVAWFLMIAFVLFVYSLVLRLEKEIQHLDTKIQQELQDWVSPIEATNGSSVPEQHDGN